MASPLLLLTLVAALVVPSPAAEFPRRHKAFRPSLHQLEADGGIDLEGVVPGKHLHGDHHHRRRHKALRRRLHQLEGLDGPQNPFKHSLGQPRPQGDEETVPELTYLPDEEFDASLPLAERIKPHMATLAMLNGDATPEDHLKHSGADKYLYLIRHGESEWNRANALKKGFGFAFDKHSGSTLVDASLNAKGVAEALLLCANTNIVSGDEKGGCGCLAAALALYPGIFKDAQGNRQALEQPAGHGLNHAQVLTGENKELVTYVTSPLVRAIETFYFATQPAQPIKTYLSTDIQEIGKGYDGNIHAYRRCYVKEKGESDAQCLRRPTKRQADLLGEWAKKPDFNHMMSGHEAFWESSTVFPTPESYQAVYGDVKEEGFDVDPFRWQSDHLAARKIEERRQDKAIYHQMMQSFLRFTHALSTPFVVVAGHSHFFGHMLEDTSDNKICQQYGKAMQNNGAVWRVKVQFDKGKKKYMVDDCQMVFGRFKNTPSAEAITHWEGYAKEAASVPHLEGKCGLK